MKSVKKLKKELLYLIDIARYRANHIALIKWLDRINIFEEKIDDGWRSVHFENKSYSVFPEFYAFQICNDIIINYSSSHCGRMLQNIRFFENNDFNRIIALSNIEFWDRFIDEIIYFINEKSLKKLQKIISSLKEELEYWKE